MTYDEFSYIFIGILFCVICFIRFFRRCVMNRPISHRERRRIMINRLSPNNRELIMIRMDRKNLFKPIESPNGECVICLDNYNDLECCSLKCEHTFHKKCIETWFIEKQSCPLCRENII